MSINAMSTKLEVCPEGDFKLKFRYRSNEETLEDVKHWDGRILADRLSALLYNFRKLLRSPNLFLRTVEALEDHYKKMGQTDLAEDTKLSSHELLMSFEDDPSALNSNYFVFKFFFLAFFKQTFNNCALHNSEFLSTFEGMLLI